MSCTRLMRATTLALGPVKRECVFFRALVRTRGATRAEIPYALAEINWKSVGNHGNLARNQKSGP